MPGRHNSIANLFFCYIKSKGCCFKLKSVTSSRNCGIYNRVINRNEVIFRYIYMSMQDTIYTMTMSL